MADGATARSPRRRRGAGGPRRRGEADPARPLAPRGVERHVHAGRAGRPRRGPVRGRRQLARGGERPAAREPGTTVRRAARGAERRHRQRARAGVRVRWRQHRASTSSTPTGPRCRWATGRSSCRPACPSEAGLDRRRRVRRRDRHPDGDARVRRAVRRAARERAWDHGPGASPGAHPRDRRAAGRQHLLPPGPPGPLDRGRDAPGAADRAARRRRAGRASSRWRSAGSTRSARWCRSGTRSGPSGRPSAASASSPPTPRTSCARR